MTATELKKGINAFTASEAGKILARKSVKKRLGKLTKKQKSEYMSSVRNKKTPIDNYLDSVADIMK